MSKLDEMRLAEIISETSLCLTADSLLDIWKTDAIPQRNTFNPDGVSAVEQLRKEGLADELIGGTPGKLSRFLFAHENEINKVKLVLNMLRNYKQSLETKELSPEKRKNFQEGLAATKRLLKDVNETFVYYVRDLETNKLEKLVFVNTQDEVEGGARDPKTKNVQRLATLEAEEEFSNIIAYLTVKDIENLIPYSRKNGGEIRFMIEYNTAIDEAQGDIKHFSEICQTKGFDNFVAGLKQPEFIPEMQKALRTHIEEINLDKLFICAAIRYMEALESGNIPKQEIPEAYRRIKVIQKHVKKNARLNIPAGGKKEKYYDTNDLAIDMRRFVVEGEKVEYFTIQKCEELRKAIMTGEISLNSLTIQEYQALQFDFREVDSILQCFPNNYIFFLRENILPHSKQKVLENIINSNQCSQELLKLLCEKTDITCEEICQLFDMGIISTSDLESIKSQREAIITDEKLYEKYIEHLENKDEEESEKTRIQLERYALAYRKLELAGKTKEEIEQRGEEFVIKVGEDIKPEDLINLYGLDLIPLKVAVDWGGEDITEKLLKAERLKPSDARYLRDKGLLNREILERLFQNCINMSYAYQVALVCTVFDGQTPEEQEAKQKLAQYYHIENGISNVGKKANSRQIKRNTRTEDGPEQKIKMRDPGAKYNLLSSLDKDVKIEEGIIDGHIIFHYPDIDGGTVLIEKLHKITTNKDNGLIEIRADNSSATYIISEEEFIKIRSRLIQNGKIDRTELTQKWFREPGYWVAHTGKYAWERGIRERFQIDSTNPRYLPEDLARMEELLRISAESRDVETR